MNPLPPWGAVFCVWWPDLRQKKGEPDADVIAAAQRGDRQAMHQLLAPWNDPIYGFLLANLRNRSDAEDASQEVFIRVVKSLPGYEHRGEFRAWIFRIARNQAALTATRRQRITTREISVEPEELTDFASDDTREEDLATADRAIEVRQALENLPATEREVVRLRLDEDLKFHEIATRTGAPLNTVLGRMRNAMRRMRETLSTPTS